MNKFSSTFVKVFLANVVYALGVRIFKLVNSVLGHLDCNNRFLFSALISFCFISAKNSEIGRRCHSIAKETGKEFRYGSKSLEEKVETNVCCCQELSGKLFQLFC